MLNSIYTPLSGGLAQEKVLEIIANNLANLNTVGFKEEQVTFKLLEPEAEINYTEPLPPANFELNFEDLHLRGNEMNYVGVSGVSRNDLQGSPLDTKNPLDLMIEGEGYFQISTPEGERYTRNGSFSLSPEGALVDKNGNPVMGTKGSIFLGSGKVEINARGEVYQNAQLVDRISLHTFEDKKQLEKIGLNYYSYSGPETGETKLQNPSIKQGFLEGSNVNAIKNLTGMIMAHRSYEAYQKAIKNFDSMMEKSNNTLAEVR